MTNLNRRTFMKSASMTAVAASTNLHMLAASPQGTAPKSLNDQVQFALIGAGIQGQGDTKNALRTPGVKLMAVADCYDGRLAHAKELWGDDIFTTRDYKEILARKDIDAVIIATPDHWHKQAAVDAMKAGKDVYLEKPMIHVYPDGPEIIETAHSTNRILQIGSQRVSSVVYAKAKDLLASGAIGKLNMGHRSLGPQFFDRAHGTTLYRPTRALRPATGRASKAPRRKCHGRPSASSSGASGMIMGPA